MQQGQDLLVEPCNGAEGPLPASHRFFPPLAERRARDSELLCRLRLRQGEVFGDVDVAVAIRRQGGLVHVVGLAGVELLPGLQDDLPILGTAAAKVVFRELHLEHLRIDL